MVGQIWNYTIQNWGNLFSAVGVLISVITLMKVSSINTTQKQERAVIKKVLDLEELQIRIEETKIVLQDISEQLSCSDNKENRNLLFLLNERMNVLFQTSGKLSSAIESINILKEDGSEKVSGDYFAKARGLLREEKFKEAIDYYERCVIFFEKLKNEKHHYSIMHGNYGIALCYIKLKDYNQARYYSDKAHKVATLINDNEMINSCNLLKKEIEDADLDKYLEKTKRR